MVQLDCPQIEEGEGSLNKVFIIMSRQNLINSDLIKGTVWRLGRKESCHIGDLVHFNFRLHDIAEEWCFSFSLAIVHLLNAARKITSRTNVNKYYYRSRVRKKRQDWCGNFFVALINVKRSCLKARLSLRQCKILLCQIEFFLAKLIFAKLKQLKNLL